MRDNNFNLLYSKLGWYGNHYILPNERIIQLQALSRSPRQINVEPLVRYTRCVYGKAVIPKSPQGFLYCAEIMKGYIVANFLPSVYRNQERSEESQYDSAGRLLCYTLDNFYIPSSTSFI